MRNAKIERLQHDEDKNNLLLVDRLWKLKKASEKKLSLHIQLNKLVRDRDYRSDLIDHARKLDDPSINTLIMDIEGIQGGAKSGDNNLSTIDSGSSMESFFSGKLKNRGFIVLLTITGIVIVFLMILMLLFYNSLKSKNELIEFKLNEMVRAGQINEAITNDRIGNSDSRDNTEVIDKALLVSEEPDRFENPPVKDLDFFVSPSLSFHGSNTIGEKLMPKLIEAFYVQEHAKNLQWKTGDLANEKVLAFLNSEYEPNTVELRAHGSSTGFKALMNDQADIAMASRPIKDKEYEALSPIYGNMRSRRAEHVLGLDGVAVITHPDNVITQLTIKQLSNIYSGEITNWSSLGGKNQEISVFSRDDNSGTWDTFESLVLKPNNQSLSASALRHESSSELSHLVSRTPGSIGFVALPYIRDAGVVAISATSGSLPVIPTRFTIATEDYPLSRRLFLYNSPQKENELVSKFINFSLSKAGQDIVESLGLASQNIKLQQPSIPDDAPHRYKILTENAQRLSLNFRFQQGADILDNKAQRDLSRLVDFMAGHSEKALLLFGFSDSAGSQELNNALSLERARSLQKALNIRGLAPSEVLGFGEQLPLAANTTLVGRTKNRRVEVWLR